MPVNPVVFDVLRLRQAATRITAGKLVNALASVSPDLRLRDMYVYYGAHTGRYSGQKVQTHNLPRGIDGLDVVGLLKDFSYEKVKVEADRRKVGIADVLSSLIRPCFTATPGNVLLVSDYNAIEPRCLAWVSDEENLLNVFRRGDDPYKDIASKLYNIDIGDVDDYQRFVGKQLIIGCGYQVSAVKFALMLAQFGVDIEKAGVTPEQCVDTYRAAYPRISGSVAGHYNGVPYRRGGIWHLFADAAISTVTDGTVNHVGKCVVAEDDRHMTITLPSGRPIVYRNARIEWMRAKIAGKAIGDPKPTVVFDHPRGYTSVLFGGKITENVVQGICRDLLCDAMEKCENDTPQIPIVLDTHDEIVAESPKEHGDENLMRLNSHMTMSPDWAEGFPIAVKGYVTERYVKK